MGCAASDIARLLAQSEVDGFEYHDFASTFDVRLEEKLKEMQVANEAAVSSAPSLASHANRPVAEMFDPHGGVAGKGLPRRINCPGLEVPSLLRDRPIDTLFQRLSKGRDTEDEPLPALFARLR